MHIFKRCLVPCLMLLISCGSLFAAGETIYDIIVRGNKAVSPQMVTTAITLRTGDLLNPEEVARSIRQLYKMRMFSDVRISTEPYRTGVNLIVDVVENPVLAIIEYEGMKAVKKEKLDELVTVRVGSFWSDFQKHELVSKLTAEYNSKGYNNAKVMLDEQTDAEGKIRVKVSVVEGGRLAINAVTFVGNENIEDSALLKRMKTKPANLFRSGRFEQDKFDQDLIKLADYYKKNGYIDVIVGPHELISTGEKTQELVINITEGKRYTFSGITVTGNEHFTTEKLQETFTLKVDEPFDQTKFDEQLNKIYSLYYDEGFIYIGIDQEIQRADSTLTIVLNVKEGARARIRQIHITGNERTKDKVLLRELEIAPGDYFRQSQVIRSQQNIYNLGFFEPDIRLDYTPINANGDIDLQIDVIDKSAGSANGGVGYNSQDGFVGQLSLSMNNIMGNNWSSSLAWEFGGKTQDFQFSFTNPNLMDTDILLGSSIYYTTKDWSSFYYKIFTRGASIRLGQYLPWVDRTRLVAGYSLYSKKYEITNHSMIDPFTNATLVELDTLGWRYTSAVSATVSRDTRNNIYFPSRGTQMTLFSELAGGLLGGNFDYFKQIAQVNWYMELWYKLTLRTKWRFGYITPYGSSTDAPPDEKFYLGGTGVDGIRGYPDRRIGVDEDGDGEMDTGGTREIIFSTELGYPIGSDQIIGLVFFDAGDCYNKLRDFNFLKFKKGVGAGVRIQSPFGLIGFDYAYNLDKGTWEPHLQFGTTF
ncbi:MAG TPA: outer membrane protein assembly factor BamA [Candidatus Syntrophosphaera sp.]|nr:MAG: Outer membrane protein assembly factor BamA precursor [Candidatus Cloacimonetes bacterium ADurb.Bin088]HPX66555.1 outer membrane protein assembly factor BamA [Candidatus Syntrophosphaera sp.]